MKKSLLRYSLDRRAFSLLELAVSLVIAGMVAGMVMKLSATTDRNECYTTSKAQVEKVKQAVDRFAISNRRFPLPARRYVGVDSNVYGKETPLASITDLDATPPNADGSVAVFGAVPHATLGMAMDDSIDCWGNKLTYVVTKALTDTTTFANNTPGAITVEVKSGTTYSDKIGYSVIVHGEDQLGAAKANFNDLSATTPTQRQWCTADGSPKTANCNVTSSFRLAAPFNNGDNPAKYFDDVIIFRGKPWKAETANLYCWGSNIVGILGTGVGPAALPQKLTPTPVKSPPEVTNFRDVQGRALFFCAFGDNNKLYCWGSNNAGQLGDNTNVDKWKPTAVDMSTLPGVTFTSMSVGGTHACALDSTHKAYCWGSNFFGELGDNTNAPKWKPTPVDISVIPGVLFKSISAGFDGTCAIDTNDKAYCWGRLGIGTIPPRPTASYPGTYTAINTSGHNVCAIGMDGKAYCWGWEWCGQLGVSQSIHGSGACVSSHVASPTAVNMGGTVPPGVKFTNVYAGANRTTCALGDNDVAYCWGASPGWPYVVYGLGVLPGENLTITPGADPMDIADDLYTRTWSPAPYPVATPAGFKNISGMASDHFCGVGVDNRAYCWGSNGSGQIGNGSNMASPSLVNLPSGKAGFSSVVTTGMTTCGIVY